MTDVAKEYHTSAVLYARTCSQSTEEKKIRVRNCLSCIIPGIKNIGILVHLIIKSRWFYYTNRYFTRALASGGGIFGPPWGPTTTAVARLSWCFLQKDDHLPGRHEC